MKKCNYAKVFIESEQLHAKMKEWRMQGKGGTWYYERAKHKYWRLRGMLCRNKNHNHERIQRPDGSWACPEHINAPVGYIYVLKADGSDFYKIGKSKEYTDRIKKLRIQLPFKVGIYCVFKTTSTDEVERLIHDQWKENRVNGEWFKIDEDQIEQLKYFISNLAYAQIV